VHSVTRGIGDTEARPALGHGVPGRRPARPALGHGSAGRRPALTCTGARSAGRRPKAGTGLHWGHGVPAEGRHWGTACTGARECRPKAGTGLHWGHVGVPCCRPKAGAGGAEGPALRRAQCARGAVSSALCTARGSAVCAPYIYYYIYCYTVVYVYCGIYMNIRERPKIYYSMRNIPIELAYALCLVSPWMHNRSVTRAGATIVATSYS